MKYYFYNNEWKIERRKWLWAKSENNVEEKIDYSAKRRYDVRKKYMGKMLRISNAFASLGIFFDIGAMEESVIMHYYDIRKNLSEIQKYSDEMGMDFYVIVFEDESFVAFKGGVIKLYHDEECVDRALELLSENLERIGADVRLKKIRIQPD